MGIITLDVPLSVKVAAVADITAIDQNVPAQYLGQIIGLLVSSIQTTFLFGLGCAIAAAITAFAVPWKPIVAGSPIGRESTGLPFWRKRTHRTNG